MKNLMNNELNKVVDTFDKLGYKLGCNQDGIMEFTNEELKMTIAVTSMNDEILDKYYEMKIGNRIVRVSVPLSLAELELCFKILKEWHLLSKIAGDNDA